MKIDLRNIIAINAQKNILVLLQSYENPNEELGEDVILIMRIQTQDVQQHISSLS
jgi:hypothetical protein